jgi:hypothetical protein
MLPKAVPGRGMTRAMNDTRTMESESPPPALSPGPSQTHTFDPKLSSAYPSISTAIPGVRFADCLPKLAAAANDLAILRSMSTDEIEHERACFLIQTSYQQIGGADFPPLGSIVSAEIGRPESSMPNYVAVDAGRDGRYIGTYRPGPAYLGSRHSPLIVEDPAKGVDNLKPAISERQFDARARLLAQAEQSFNARLKSPAATAHQTAFGQALKLMRSRQSQAFDLDTEPASLRDAYGDNKFGRACLLARRLVEAGVSFVEVRHEGWDDHSGATPLVNGRCNYIDPAMSTLILDLKLRGLLEETLVIWMGEFGRSPGDDKLHWPQAWTAVFAGGGLNVGQTIGRTDDKGGEVVDRPTNEIDFMATVCRALGIDPLKKYTTAGGRPVTLVDYQRSEPDPVAELF